MDTNVLQMCEVIAKIIIFIPTRTRYTSTMERTSREAINRTIFATFCTLFAVFCASAVFRGWRGWNEHPMRYFAIILAMASNKILCVNSLDTTVVKMN